MSTGQTASGGGIGFCGMLAILFIALKLLGYIGWSWWWVLAPLWIPFALVALAFVLLVLFFALCELLPTRKRGNGP